MKLGMLIASGLAAALLAPAVARAETVTGTFRYADENYFTQAVTMRPISFARVEVHRFRPRPPFGIWTWGHDATTTTDANGRLNLPMDFVAPGVIYGVKVFATNYAAIVWPNDVLHTVPFHREPGEPDGRIINFPVTAPDDTLDFSYDFNERWSSQHFNIAETIRVGYDFVTARRAPGEPDLLPAAAVQPTSVTPNSYYNFLFDTVVVESKSVFADFVILHEYGHFLEHKIGMFAPIPSVHNGCTAMLGPLDLTFAEVAWMEGFSDWFAQTVGLRVPGAGLVGGSFSAFTLETPPPCEVLPNGDRIELRVAGALWDLVDAPGLNGGGVTEAADTLRDREAAVIQIMDRELDPPDGTVRTAPNINLFRNAWIRRGLPACPLGQIYRALSIPMSTNFAAVASAGRDARVRRGSLVRLNASASCDPEGRPLQFRWRQIGGLPRVSVSNAATAVAEFRAPAVPTALQFRVTVTDGARSTSDVVVIRVT